MLLIEGLRSLQRPTYLQTPIGGHHHQLRSLDLVGQLTTLDHDDGNCGVDDDDDVEDEDEEEDRGEGVLQQLQF